MSDNEGKEKNLGLTILLFSRIPVKEKATQLDWVQQAVYLLVIHYCTEQLNTCY
jgi:hypothetical protein